MKGSLRTSQASEMAQWIRKLSRSCLGVVVAAAWSCGSACAQTPVLNELMASNALAFFDDFFEADDWVEIYNPGGLLNLAGYHISDDPADLTKYTIPSSDPGSTFMTPGDHVILWLDKDSIQGVMHANFRLSSENEGIWLTAPDGITVLDSIVYPPQQTDISFGRSCDGCLDWVFFNVPTPEATNAQTQVPTPQLFINEVLLDNSYNLVDEFQEADAWLEIYNPNPFQVNLAGYTLQSDLGFASTLPMDSPVETTIAADGFLLLWLDGQPEQGGHHTEEQASSSGQTFALKGPDGVTADTYTAEVSFANISWGRVSDGAPSSTWFDIPTPGVSNNLLIIPPANWVINEVMTQNLATVPDDVGEFDDWVEIHNPTNVPLDLAGYYVSDKLNNPTKWQVPSGVPDFTVIPPGGYVLLWADEQGSQGWNHMNFKLSSLGEVVVLRSPDGFSIADSLHFGAINPDESLARLPNATGPFVITANPTPGECNDCPSFIQLEGVDVLLPVLWPTVSFPRGSIHVDCPGSLFNAAGSLQFTTNVAGTHTAPTVPGLYVYHARDGRRGVLVVSRN
ncbi:MAG: lamin tail domain-containing protein [Bacteroidetes bacterium]|nr:lamin tail domain-containing protein [Bacteroidota bacterium]